jgi:hypothetical protein
MGISFTFAFAVRYQRTLRQWGQPIGLRPREAIHDQRKRRKDAAQCAGGEFFHGRIYQVESRHYSKDEVKHGFRFDAGTTKLAVESARIRAGSASSSLSSRTTLT